MYESLAILALFSCAYSLIAGKIDKGSISGPILFCIFGVLMGPQVLNHFPMAGDIGTIKILAELTLALVLFTDAAGADLSVLRQNARIPIRLLMIGLPLTLALGYGLGMALFDGVALLELGLLATMLAPTDAALGKPVVTNKKVPAEFREGLNVESGLNDGICVPILLVLLELATGETNHEGGGLSLVLSHFAAEIGIGAAVGVSLVLITVSLGKYSQRHGWIAKDWAMTATITLALACFALAQSIGGSGFIAAFIGGLTMNQILGKKAHPWLEETESAGDLFSLVTWIAFGALAIDLSAAAFDWRILLYGVLSLTVIRMVPVFLALSGIGLSMEAKLFTGWFGPRGLASVVFCVMILDAQLPSSKLLAHVVVVTVLLSIILHGITANAWANGFAKRAQQKTTR
jgi:NhaP-type Na+/H+ or K+/H+ antiporter